MRLVGHSGGCLGCRTRFPGARSGATVAHLEPPTTGSGNNRNGGTAMRKAAVQWNFFEVRGVRVASEGAFIFIDLRGRRYELLWSRMEAHVASLEGFPRRKGRFQDTYRELWNSIVAEGKRGREDIADAALRISGHSDVREVQQGIDELLTRSKGSKTQSSWA